MHVILVIQSIQVLVHRMFVIMVNGLQNLNVYRMLVIIAVQKIYFPPEVRRNIAARFNRPCMCAPETRFRAMPTQELPQKTAEGDLRESDERIPTLLN